MAGTTVRSRRLAGILKDYRLASGLKLAAAAAYVGKTSAWLSKSEKPATCRISVGDVRCLLTLYGVTDEAEVERVIALAAQVKEPGWWHGYDLPESYAAFVALESEAEQESAWEPQLVPGLLQTADYARVVIAMGKGDVSPARLEQLVRVRAERAKVLHRPGPLSLHAVFGENVLRRGAGGAAVMVPQLRHLEDMMRAGVLLQVLPFAAGAHPGMDGAFTVLRYPDPADPDVLYAETPAGALYVEDDSAVRKSQRAFADLSALALSPRDTMDMVARYAAGL
jgi:hypothetical protein